MRSSSRSTTLLALVLAVVAGVLAYLALTPPTPAPSRSTAPATTTTSSTTAAKLRLTIIGDSITQGDSPSFDTGVFGDRSWAKYLTEDKYDFFSGLARGGLTTYDATQLMKPIDTNIVVAFLGTNDLHTGSSTQVAAENLKTLYAATRPDGPHYFVVVAAGPTDLFTYGAMRNWNADIKKRVEGEGFTFADPWDGLRTDKYGWVAPDLHIDRLHPTAKGAKILGENMSRILDETIAKGPGTKPVKSTYLTPSPSSTTSAR